jgi:hypothetical protein
LVNQQPTRPPPPAGGGGGWATKKQKRRRGCVCVCVVCIPIPVRVIKHNKMDIIKISFAALAVAGNWERTKSCILSNFILHNEYFI